MLVEIKDGRKWVTRDVSEWNIEVKEKGRWVLLGRLNQEKQRRQERSHRQPREHSGSGSRSTISVRRARKCRSSRQLSGRETRSWRAVLDRCYGKTLAITNRQAAATPDHRLRYCGRCHQLRRDTPCAKCGGSCPLLEQMNRVPERHGGRRYPHFFVQGGRPDSNRRRH